ncbi:MAG: hypothetical protein GJU76_00840 [Gallionella sp.]|nr:hypothetical protein [Gallionella sp.]
MVGTVMFIPKAIAVASCFAAVLLSGCGSNVVSFKENVEPILAHNCAMCHSPGGIGYAMTGFSVQDYATLMKGSKFGPLVDPGSSQQSNLIWLLRHGAHHIMNMPKECEHLAADGKCTVASENPRKMPATQVNMIATWIDQGARDN